MQVPGAIQDSQALKGFQETEASQETLDPWAPQACPLEMQVIEVYNIKRYLGSGMDMDQLDLLAHMAFLCLHLSFL